MPFAVTNSALHQHYEELEFTSVEDEIDIAVFYDSVRDELEQALNELQSGPPIKICATLVIKMVDVGGNVHTTYLRT